LFFASPSVLVDVPCKKQDLTPGRPPGLMSTL
jgi:hypothetical protein